MSTANENQMEHVLWEILANCFRKTEIKRSAKPSERGLTISGYTLKWSRRGKESILNQGRKGYNGKRI